MALTFSVCHTLPTTGHFYYDEQVQQRPGRGGREDHIATILNPAIFAFTQWGGQNRLPFLSAADPSREQAPSSDKCRQCQYRSGYLSERVQDGGDCQGGYFPGKISFSITHMCFWYVSRNSPVYIARFKPHTLPSLFYVSYQGANTLIMNLLTSFADDKEAPPVRTLEGEHNVLSFYFKFISYLFVFISLFCTLQCEAVRKSFTRHINRRLPLNYIPYLCSTHIIVSCE